MSATHQCQNFVRNAWKKDLCSNCYKSKEEHVKKIEVTKVYARLPDPPKEGILRGSSRKSDRSSSCNVGFHIKEYEIIGYGGDDYYSDDGEDDVPDHVDQSPEEEDTEEDKAIQKLTKTNTDFNSVIANLSESKGVTTVIEPLRLGQPLVDGSGKKKTLFISVTPFGGSVRNNVSKLEPRDNANIVDKPFVKGVVVKSVAAFKSSDPKTAYDGQSATDADESRPSVEEKKRIPEVMTTLMNETKNELNALSSIHKTGITLDIYDLQHQKENHDDNDDDDDDNDAKAKESMQDDNSKKPCCNNEVMTAVEKLVEETVCENSSDEADNTGVPPALPSSPPPSMINNLDPRSSFLHRLASVNPEPRRLGEKPQLPVKPIIVQSKKINLHSPVVANRPKSPSMETFLDIYSTPVKGPHLPLVESLSDSAKKRQAPKPPSPVSEPLRVFRSTENLLVVTTSADAQSPDTVDGCENVPRKSLSLSQDNLLNSNTTSDLQIRKKPHRGRFFLRKLLHLGKQKDSTKDAAAASLNQISTDTVKPKLEIIHPLNLDGAQVEVVPPLRSTKTRRSSSSASSSSGGEPRESDVLSDSSASQSVSSSCNSDGNADSRKLPQSSDTSEKSKPTPPPRSHSLDFWPKPARPPPPKQTMNISPVAMKPLKSVKSSNEYVNLGEVRSELAPNKPVRTGSLRENGGRMVPVKEQDPKDYWTGSLRGPKKPSSFPAPPEDSGYESFEVSATSDSQASSLVQDDNVYECVQTLQEQHQQQQRGSSPECDASLHSRPNKETPVLRTTRLLSPRRSEGSLDLAPDYLKMRFIRSISAPYCGSETESEIYSPYSFCGSEMGEDDFEWSPTSGRFQKVSRLKMKKGRSVVHKSLEDNYGAVIIANHEALNQVVEQMYTGISVPAALRTLLTSVANLRWSDFTVIREGAVFAEKYVFYAALWGLYPLTLCVAPENGLSSSLFCRTPFAMNPLVELNDLVPAEFLGGLASGENDRLVQATISVLPRIQPQTLATYMRGLPTPLTEDIHKELLFVLLQIINALKLLQSQGIEEAPRSLTNFLLVREERDPQHPRICILMGSEPGGGTSTVGSLCVCMLDVLAMVPCSRVGTAVLEVLERIVRGERAQSLSLAKGLLEFALWGPADVVFGVGEGEDCEAALQRWLDLERATVLQGLVRTRTDLTVFEEWHLLFLARTTSKMMANASLIIQGQPIPAQSP